MGAFHPLNYFYATILWIVIIWGVHYMFFAG